MISVLKKELFSYFTSAIGYVVLTVFFIYAGFCFYVTCLMANSADLSYTFSNLFTAMVFLIPIITMRLMSEEKKQKTDQLLFTAPVSLPTVVLGKYFSALCMILLCESVTILYTLVISFFTRPNFGIIAGNFLGLFLISGAFAAIGLFLSSVTENQIIAATGSFGVGVFFLLLDTIARSIPVSAVNKLLLNISFMQKYNNFTAGVLELRDVVFFISVIFTFLFLTVRFFEKRRWS